MVKPEPPATPEIAEYLAYERAHSCKRPRTFVIERLLLNHVWRTYGEDGLLTIPALAISREWHAKGGTATHHPYVLRALGDYRFWHDYQYGSWADEAQVDAVIAWLERLGPVDRRHLWRVAWERIRRMRDRSEPPLQERFDRRLADCCPDAYRKVVEAEGAPDQEVGCD
jgi:hypothetical protein